MSNSGIPTSDKVYLVSDRLQWLIIGEAISLDDARIEISANRAVNFIPQKISPEILTEIAQNYHTVDADTSSACDDNFMSASQLGADVLNNMGITNDEPAPQQLSHGISNNLFDFAIRVFHSIILWGFPQVFTVDDFENVFNFCHFAVESSAKKYAQYCTLIDKLIIDGDYCAAASEHVIESLLCFLALIIREYPSTQLEMLEHAISLKFWREAAKKISRDIQQCIHPPTKFLESSREVRAEAVARAFDDLLAETIVDEIPDAIPRQFGRFYKMIFEPIITLENSQENIRKICLLNSWDLSAPKIRVTEFANNCLSFARDLFVRLYCADTVSASEASEAGGNVSSEPHSS